jgi:Putative beta-barrel porin 2
VRIAAGFFALFLCVSAAVSAQDPPDPFDTARMRFGPVALTPGVALTNLGVDTNVFNQVENPKKDFTLTLTPQAQAWLRLGRGRLSGQSRLDLVYFQQYSTERSVNSSAEGRFELPLNRFRPFVSDSFIHSRERPGYEIDARARHLENTFTIGGTVKLGAKTDLEISVYRRRTTFDADAVFQGSRLSDLLNRRENGLRATARYHVTPLTTFLIVGDAQTTRFDLSPIRNADSVRITPGVELEPFALISGRAYVGFRKYDALGSGVPSYMGPVATADVGYTLLGRTRLSMQADRDIAYSFEPLEPYYLLTGVTGTATHRLTNTWDVRGTAGRQRLDFRHVGMAVPGQERVDFVYTYGAGVGYRLGRDMRLGLNIDRYRRTSDRLTRDYNGLRVGASVTYGT